MPASNTKGKNYVCLKISAAATSGQCGDRAVHGRDVARWRMGVRCITQSCPAEGGTHRRARRVERRLQSGHVGHDRRSRWSGLRSRLHRFGSAQKAYTANAFSLPALALSTANLYTAVQPGGSLYGLATSNPIDPALAYLGPATSFGQSFDPLVGYRIGGINVFGGGLALYAKGGVLIGAVGVSGDSSCADHNIAWRTRNNLHLDYVPGGVSGDSNHPDGIVFDITSQPGQMPGDSASGWGHPYCSSVSTAQASVLAIATALPPTE